MDRTSVISIDAMGGDRGPAAVVGGIAKAARKNPAIRFLVHGDAEEIDRLMRRRPGLADRVEVRDAKGVVSMDAKPSKVVRQAQGTSMMSAIDSVAAGEAAVAVSCGNTGALMALSTLRLRRAPGVDRPAIAVLWPSRTKAGYCIVLDVGADVRADPENLLQFAVMGAEYAHLALDIPRPRVGILNVGAEEHKGRAGLHQAHGLVAAAARETDRFDYVGFVEGDDIPCDTQDVVVTDGFTGNIALKTGEGTASLIREFLGEAFRHTWLSRLGAAFALTSLRRLQKRIDPRRVNGGVFLGLNGAVVKSHGDADATGFAAAIKLAFRMGQTSFAQNVAERIANTPMGDKTDRPESKDPAPTGTATGNRAP